MADNFVRADGSVVVFGTELLAPIFDAATNSIAASTAAAAVSATLASGYETAAAAQADRAIAAVDIAVASLPIYRTKALANAALAGLADGTVVEVEVDESRSDHRTRYQKVAGAFVYAIDLPRVPPGGDIVVVNASGNVGIGTDAPISRLHVNTSAATATHAAIGNDNGVVRVGVSDSGVGQVLAYAGIGLSFGSDNLAGAVVEFGRFDTTGNLLVGTTSGTGHSFNRNVAEGNPVLSVGSQFTGGNSLLAYSVSVNGYNAAGAALQIGRHSTTSRSINAGGTINASGADYAEYMTKADGCGVIAKGDVCGIDSDGKLTKTWAATVRWVIKSTDPNLVGGDAWATHLGPMPMQDEDETDDAFAARMETFFTALEAARQTVDRIAFCGMVPVNFDGDCQPGDYLIAVANGGGIGVEAIASNAITFDQYRRRVGVVLAIRDGRPWVTVQQG